MSIKIRQLGRLFGILCVTSALACPALVLAAPHGGFHGGAHFGGRPSGHVFMGHSFGHSFGGNHFAGRNLGHNFGTHNFGHNFVRPQGGHPAFHGPTGFGRNVPGRVNSGRRFGGNFVVGGAGSHFVGDHDGRFAGDHEGRFRGDRDGHFRGDHDGRFFGDRGDGWDWDDHPLWAGGWWGGDYWPRVYYDWNYPWFLNTLPVGVVTLWWGGVPYYYVNNVYYVWSSANDGYVVTNPPPVAGNANNGESWYTDPPAASSSASNSVPSHRGPDDVYMYPLHGQSKKQQENDRYACHVWAEKQTGFNPTRPAYEQSASGTDYHRALVACLKGRGYSVD